MSRTIKIECRYAAKPAEVFEAFTKPESLTEWFAECARVDLGKGLFEFWGRYTPRAPGEPVSKLVGYEAGSSLRFTWAIDGADTPVAIEMATADEGTLVTIAHEVPKRGKGEASVADFWSLALENLRRFLLGMSEVVWCDYSNPARGSVGLEIDINSDPDAVFRTLIEPAELERYMATKATVEPRVGGQYDVGWGVGPIKILELDTPNKLSYSWKHGEDGETVVTWSLEGSGDRTRLTLVHNGFTADRYSEDYRTGWLKFMNDIKSMVEIGASWKAAKLDNPDHEEEC